MSRAGVRLVAILALCSSLAGCSPYGEACSAVGWASTVSIELTGDTRVVDAVQLLCDNGPCGDGPVERLENVWNDESMTPTPAPTPDGVDGYASRVDRDTWSMSFLVNVPDRATVRALASNGEVLTEREVTLEWERVGGSEYCGGPTEAGPITLDIQP